MVSLPFAPAPLGFQELHLLLAPLGQLSGDGQLLELFKERGEHPGLSQLWYLKPIAIANAGLESGEPLQEGVACDDAGVITWLQLRFGGIEQTMVTTADQLEGWASHLPPAAPEARLDRAAFV